MNSNIKESMYKYKKDEEDQKNNELVNSIIESDVDAPSSSTELIQGITPEKLAEFKQQVKTWNEMDVIIKRLQCATKERKKIQQTLNDKILRFMISYGIEDLNTKDGTIRCKTSKIKVPMSQKNIKDKLLTTFQNNEKITKKINDIFDNRDSKEKVSLKKLKF